MNSMNKFKTKIILTELTKGLEAALDPNTENIVKHQKEAYIRQLSYATAILTYNIATYIKKQVK